MTTIETSPATATLVDRILTECFGSATSGGLDRFTTDARLRAMHDAVADAFPGARLTPTWTVVEDRRVAVGGILTGTHAGPWRGLAPTGRPIEVLATLMLACERGQVVDLVVVVDSLTLAEQLGAAEPLAPKVCELPVPEDRYVRPGSCHPWLGVQTPPWV